MMRPTLVGVVALVGSTGCGFGESAGQSSPIGEVEGPYGLEGFEGELDGSEVRIPFAGHTGGVGPDGLFSFYPFLPDGYAFIQAAASAYLEPSTVDIDLGLLLMPPDEPKGAHWLCAGEGSDITNIDHSVYVAQLENISDMGTCQDAPDGDWFLRFWQAHPGQDLDEWEASTELHLDTVQDTPEGTTTDYGRVYKYFPSGHVDAIGVPFELDGGAVLVPNPSGQLQVVCPGSGSTITFHEEPTPDGPEYWEELDLVGVSIVGQCPGNPVEGSIKIVKGQTGEDG